MMISGSAQSAGDYGMSGVFEDQPGSDLVTWEFREPAAGSTTTYDY